jgi:tRNA threonylcarbamoyladenosine biosynthesis protein TsaB
LAYILCIESATTNCSVALTEDGKVVAAKELNAANFSHAEHLHDFILDVLAESSVNINNIDAISVSKGPGSYTGLRIGVSAAKGLAFGIKVPLISVGTLEALAHQIKVDSGYILPILDARRMEVYAQVFSAEHTPLNSVEAVVLEENSFEAYLSTNQVHFMGSGALKFSTICKHPNALFYSEFVPSAKEQAILAYSKFQKKDFEDTAYFEPFYLKDFVAGSKKA